ncbi:DUF1491 family protein [Sphingomonas morindae]|uniref:DUF1491 family protein n=1 Tax=Sphingomonas morindae TaxID=1541170 RepID=A0ABY4XB92_9SPHN|nr:DUF1491 family protein [Sphingomonas morindae]USI74245.1 DUF1491 family protein [Sphingomonas morindae]
MSAARLAARIEATALMRLAEARGGSAALLHRGHAEAGTILVYLADRGAFFGLFERLLQADSRYRWTKVGPQDVENSEALNTYIRGRTRIDPDLWVVELDIAGVERFAAEMIATG